jgi:hypothetical protein
LAHTARPSHLLPERPPASAALRGGYQPAASPGWPAGAEIGSRVAAGLIPARDYPVMSTRRGRRLTQDMP